MLGIHLAIPVLATKKLLWRSLRKYGTMSLKTLPLLFVNLGGEMMYILDQRLRAQNIQEEKAKKVLNDIVSTMFNTRFMEELFKPQELYSKKAMRTVFDRLAHASIMRLNAASMDKLYDLMTMAVKYQISLCLRPSDILLVTLNHMDAVRAMVKDSQSIKTQVDNVYRLLLHNFASLSAGEFQLVRQTLLNFFQDMHIRVSIFLRDKVQNSSGKFALPTSGPVPWGTEVPGTIKLFNAGGEMVKSTTFESGGQYVMSVREGSFDMTGERVTKLGSNMYSKSKPSEVTSSAPAKSLSVVADTDQHVPNPLAKAQLELLSKLIGGGEPKKQSAFRLNFFNTDEEEQEAEAARPPEEPGSMVINIDASKKKRNAELNRIMGEMTVGEGGDQDDDLLDLMDKA